MTCYAPLFAHEEAWQWRPDLIWFDNLNVYGSAYYYVQKLFSLHPGTHLLQAQVNDIPALSTRAMALHVSTTLDKAASEVLVKAVNVSGHPIETTVHLENVTKVGPQCRVILLASEKLSDENSLTEPRKIYPQETRESITGPTFNYDFTPYSLTVLRIPVR
jgi:alpha-N-arabinofuranosidase